MLQYLKFLGDITVNTSNLTVYKANEVIEAGYKISLNEQRVVLACISQIDSRKEVLKTDKFELSAKDFANIFEVSEKRAYQALVEVSENLFNRYIVITNPPDEPDIKKLKTRWISSIRYNQNQGKIVLRFAQDILPYLSSLEGTFTKYELKHIGKMTSIYAIRLYELLMQWRTTGKREVDIEWLKEQFQLDEGYSRMFDLKKRVIEPAIKDINTHSNFTVKWEQRKTGRKVTHLTFTFVEKQPEPAQKPAAKPKAKAEMINGVRKAEIEKRARPGESYEQTAERIKREKETAIKKPLKETIKNR